MANRLGARQVRLRIVTTARQIALRWLAGRIPLQYVPRRCERTSVSIHRAGNDRSRRRGAGATDAAKRRVLPRSGRRSAAS